MKTPFPLLCLAACLAGHFAGCAASPGGRPAVPYTLATGPSRNLLPPYPTDEPLEEWLANLDPVEPVTDLDKRDVLQRFGRPGERLTDDIWIYWRFHSAEVAAQNGGYDTLVVAFARGRVSRMKLVQGEALRTRLAGAWPSPAGLAAR